MQPVSIVFSSNDTTERIEKAENPPPVETQKLEKGKTGDRF